MPGVRVHHPTLRSGRYTVETPRQQYGVPYACPICKRLHYYKAHHIELDDNGNGIVSEGVLEELRYAGMAGLEIVNEVPKPPPVTIGDPRWNGHVPIIGMSLLKEE